MCTIMCIVMKITHPTPPPKNIFLKKHCKERWVKRSCEIRQNFFNSVYLWTAGVEGPGDGVCVPLLQEQEVLDPVNGGAALPQHADGEGEEERHGQPHRVVQRQRQEGLLRSQHLWAHLGFCFIQ